jgi:hypothetical protein
VSTHGTRHRFWRRAHQGWFGIGLGGATRERSGQRCSVVEKIGRRLSEEFAVHPECTGRRELGGQEGPKALVPNEPILATIGPVVRVEFERVEALELLGMTLAHLNDAEARADVSPRMPLLMAIRDKLARGLREES